MADATALSNLTTAIEQITDQLVDMTANPKPSYSVDGQSVSWGEHFNNLTNTLKVLMEARMMLFGPFEFRTQIVT